MDDRTIGEILDEEDLTEEERARFEKLRDQERARDRVEKIQRSKERNEKRLRALADLSLLYPMDAAFHDDITPREVPLDSQPHPKKGRTLSDSGDYLFLAALLERSHDADYILQCGPRGRTEEWIYLPDTRIDELPEGYTVKQRLSSNHVRRLFKGSFFGFRRGLAETHRPEWSHSIGGTEIRHAGSRGDKPFWDFAARLHHPFRKGYDPLMEELYARRFFTFAETRGTREAPFLCPIDGPVRAVEGALESPNWTWRELCGREFRVALCPKCLGQLATIGYSMN